VRAHELPEEAARDLLQPPAAAAGRTGDDLRPRLRPVSAAAGTADGDLERHLARRSSRRIHELDLDLGGDVAASRAAAAAAREEVVAEEGGEQIGEAPEVEVAGRVAAAAQTGVAVAVVELTRLGLGQHLVRLDDLAEARLGIGRLGDVGVELAG
jgi:hypothetical protein